MDVGAFQLRPPICLALHCSEHRCWMWPPWVRFPTVAEHTVTCQQGLGSLVGIS